MRKQWCPCLLSPLPSAGEYLDEAADTTCTWISPDGGSTWLDVMPTAAIYEVHLPPPGLRLPASCAACKSQQAKMLFRTGMGEMQTMYPLIQMTSGSWLLCCRLPLPACC